MRSLLRVVIVILAILAVIGVLGGNYPAAAMTFGTLVVICLIKA